MADSEDDEFSIVEGGTLTQTGMSTLVNNLPHDEEVELSDDSQEDASNVDEHLHKKVEHAAQVALAAEKRVNEMAADMREMKRLLEKLAERE